MGSLDDCVNMTTSHFCYQSYQQKPPAASELTKEDEIRLELQRQEIDDVIKYIESDAVPGKSKNRRKRKHNQIKAAAAAAAAAAEKEAEVDSECEKSGEEQKAEQQEEGATEVTKKKKRRRKNKRKKEERDEESSGEQGQQVAPLKIINLEYIEDCSTQAGASLCISKLSDVEFDQSMSAFV